MPVSLVGQSVGLVEELPDSLHLVVSPLPLIQPSVLVVELTETVLLTIEFVALVLAALTVQFSHVDALWVGSLRGVEADAVIGVGEDRIVDFVVGW